MLEVYFNIVEWGYHVYGIGPAARYYFGKTPSQLTLGESIFLASLLPNPKAGLYAFLPDGSLRPGLHGYFNLIGNLMAGHGKAQRDSNAYGFYDVRLKESLRRGISSLDTARADSLMQQSNDDDAIPIVEPEKKMNFFQRLFGKKDTTSKKEVKRQPHTTLVDYGGGIIIDTAGKTKKQIRQEKRALKKQQKQLENESKENGGE
jgi:membrane peptidoglycan carboxypeptidase